MQIQRRVPRYSFIARTEVTNTNSSRVLLAPTGDLSHFGCFIHTSEPFPRETQIRIKIAHAGALCVVHGRVIYHTNDGMGIAFTSFEGDSHIVLEKWLANR